MSEHRPRRRRLTYADVAATLALLLAISGTAYAAATVTSADIVNRTIKVKDISAAAVFDLLPEGAVVYADDAGTFTGAGEQVVATLDPPDNANVAVFGKLWVSNEGASMLNMYCRFRGGVTSDIVWTSLAANGAPGHLEAMALNVVEFFDATEDVTLVCSPNGGSVRVFDLKITAIQTGGISDQGAG